jgi:hypothetical protein
MWWKTDLRHSAQAISPLVRCLSLLLLITKKLKPTSEFWVGPYSKCGDLNGISEAEKYYIKNSISSLANSKTVTWIEDCYWILEYWIIMAWRDRVRITWNLKIGKSFQRPMLKVSSTLVLYGPPAWICLTLSYKLVENDAGCNMPKSKRSRLLPNFKFPGQVKSTWSSWTRIEPPLSSSLASSDWWILVNMYYPEGYRHSVRSEPLPASWIHCAILRMRPCVTHEVLISLISDKLLIIPLITK